MPRGYKNWPSGHNPREHLKEFVLTSDHRGHLSLRLHESAANVTLTVLSNDKADENDDKKIVNLGLMPRHGDGLPDRFQFAFRAFPKTIEVNVHDAENHRRLSGAPVTITYYDLTKDRHQKQDSITNGEGRAIFEVDGCIGNVH